MKDLKYYKEIFCSSELELYFMEEMEVAVL